MISRKFTFFLIFLLIPLFSSGQQNNVLFFMHTVPESNFINPAVQNSCRYFIGLPVISSVHFNYGNTGFSYKQLFTKAPGTDYYTADIDNVVKRLSRVNYISTELQSTILALGYRRDYNYFTFSVIEKNNIAASFPKDLVTLIWKGNSPFEGRYADLSGTGVLLNHYREYALGYSHQAGDNKTFGIKGKLLFGKLNATTKKSNSSLFTDANTFNLLFNSNLSVNTSLPLNITTNAQGRITDISYNDVVSLSQLIFNRKNWGLAVDAGFIYAYDDRITLSGSIIDLGFIRWRSNQNNYLQNGQLFYTGIPADSLLNGDYLQGLLNSFNNAFHFNLTHNSYTLFLPPRVYLGGTYKINNRLNIGMLYSGIIYYNKINSALTVSANASVNKYLDASISYSYNNRSLNNVGAGIAIGRSPVQFYIVSDNIPGFIWPLSTRNINLRFGLNLIFGCKIKEKSKGSGCSWINGEEQRRERIKQLLHK
jgi:hypothetical protein